MTPIPRWRVFLNDLIHGAERHRAYFYRIATASSAALVAAGSIADGTASRVLFIIGAVLGLPSAGLAAANTSTEK